MNPARDLARLEERLGVTAAILEWPDERLYLRVDTVSAWSPAQHVDHVLRALGLFFGRVAVLEGGTSTDIRTEARPRVLARVVSFTGWIPRGRAEAPPQALPDPRPVRARLREALAMEARRTEALQGRVGALPSIAGTLDHPLLGPFDASRWLRFADVHTKHHLAIVAGIDRHRAVGATDAAPLFAEESDYEIGTETP